MPRSAGSLLRSRMRTVRTSADPRTGEILDADIGFFHNVMSLARNWYMVQAGAVDSRAQKLPLPDDLLGELLLYIAAHEVGHSLGFPHNMKATSMYPVDSLRSRTFTQKYGTEASIMDYGRFNYIAQPGDGAIPDPEDRPVRSVRHGMGVSSVHRHEDARRRA